MFNIIAKTIALLTVVGCVASSNSVRGQEAEASKELTELRKLQQESQQVQTQLGQIEQQALEANPELRKMQADLQELYHAKLTEYGFPNEDEMQKLREMQQRLQNSEGMKEQERQALTQKFKAEVTKLQQAQAQARQDKEVVEKLRQYEEAKLQAMNKVNDKASQLQKKFQELQQKMQQLQQKIYGQQRQ